MTYMYVYLQYTTYRFIIWYYYKFVWRNKNLMRYICFKNVFMSYNIFVVYTFLLQNVQKQNYY